MNNFGTKLAIASQLLWQIQVIGVCLGWGMTKAEYYDISLGKQPYYNAFIMPQDVLFVRHVNKYQKKHKLLFFHRSILKVNVDTYGCYNLKHSYFFYI
jgi:hypothetical protein